MHIVFLSYTYWPPDFGGELLLSIERLQSLVERGHRVTVLTSGSPGFPGSTEDRGIRIRRSPAVHDSRPGRLLRRLLFFLWASDQLRKTSFDALHLLSIPGILDGLTALMTWTLAKLAHWKDARVLIVHALADTEQKALDLQGMKKFWSQVRLGQIDHIVAVSPALYRPLKKHFPERAVLLVNGVRDDLFVPLKEKERNRLRHQWNLTEENVAFVFLGSLDRRKGFDLLAEAFVDLAKDHPNWRLWAIGPRSRGESQNIVDTQVEQVCARVAHLGTQVKFWGRIDDRHKLAGLLAAGDVFVFPSRREGMGLASVEAMATGTPVIVARLPDITDLVNIEGQTGFYVPPGKVEPLQAAIELLGTDPALRRRMGERAAHRVREAFGWEQYIDRWEALYRDGRVA